jgi:gliding motility associated protien GldN
MKRLFLVLLIGVLSISLDSNVKSQDVLDGIYQPEHTLERRVIPYAPLREADVMWLRRVWRRINLYEKANHPMYFPEKPEQGRMSLFDVIKEAILANGTLTAYDPGPLQDDDMFRKRFTTDEVKNVLSSTDTVQVENIFTGEFEDKIVTTEVRSIDVKWYEIKEELFFDKQRSVMDVRIIGICPMKAKINESSGEFQGLQPLFWIYYPEARYVFVKSEIFNRGNDVERRTYEDIIWKRQFSSYITKMSNVYNRGVSQYQKGLDALIEAERLKESIFNMEHDLWSF